MKDYLINEDELDYIVAGLAFGAEAYIIALTVMTILVAVYKVYKSSKGKTKIGNDFSFEWS